MPENPICCGTIQSQHARGLREVAVVIPYSPSYTPELMLDKAKASVKKQQVPTNIIIVENEIGPAYGRNQGIKQADARYVAFLDADDKWYDQKLVRQLDRLAKTESGICVEGPEMGQEKFISELLQDRLNSLTSSIVIDTEQVSTQFREELERFEDHCFMIEAALEAGVCFCEDLVEVRKHADGLSSENNTEIIYRNRKKMADILASETNIPGDLIHTYRSQAHYVAAIQRRKTGEFAPAFRRLVKSIRCKPSKENLRSIAALPGFAILNSLR